MRIVAWSSVAALLSLLLLGCGSRADREAAPVAQKLAEPPQTADKSAVHEPPVFAFVAPKPWQSSREGSTPLAPPDLSLETWRVLVSQTKPIQIKTPLWQSLPASQSVELSMPEGSGFRCVVTPLEVKAQANDFGTKLVAWSMLRRFVCSADGFRSWTEYQHEVRLRPDGTREDSPETGALLRERNGAQVVETYALMRTTPERREATTGPPQITTGKAIDPD